MAQDGAFLCCLRQELSETLLGGRVDKIHQPTRDELIFWMRSTAGNVRLLLSARPQAPRVHLTEHTPENPSSPPMFCMLLRKHLVGARLLAIRQNGWERALYFDFETRNELGDLVSLTLAAELMGRNSNLILIAPDGRILDAVRRVDIDAARPILPGWKYEEPPRPQDRRDLGEVLVNEAVSAITAEEGTPLSQAIGLSLQGLSPLVCREVSRLVTGDEDSAADRLTDDERARLCDALEMIKTAVLTGKNRQPTVIYDGDDQPIEFSFIPVLQYGDTAKICKVQNLSKLLDLFYAEKDEAAYRRQASQDMLRVLSTASDRILRKIGKQKQDLERAAARETKRMWGDLINANLHAVPTGADRATVVNYFDPDCALITIPLDPSLTAAQNAARYYKEYRKAQTAERVLAEQIAAGEEEVRYLDTVLDALSRAKTSRELDEIRQELMVSGYMKTPKSAKKRPQPLGAWEFRSSDGFCIRVGRNNVGNDRLTLRESENADWWFHTKNIPGSHTVVVTEGKEVPETTLREAAILAATFSKAVNSSQVPVDFTRIRHVRKPSGAKPGRVIYDHQQTVYVTPDKALAKRLQKED